MPSHSGALHTFNLKIASKISLAENSLYVFLKPQSDSNCFLYKDKNVSLLATLTLLLMKLFLIEFTNSLLINCASCTLFILHVILFLQQNFDLQYDQNDL